MTNGPTFPPSAASAVLASNNTRVWFVAGAAFSYSLFGVVSRAPGVGTIANYSAIVVGIVFALVFVFLNHQNTRLRLAELVFFFALVVAAPHALLLSQDPIDVIGNFIRASFLLVAVIFWRGCYIDSQQLIPKLYSAFWKVAVVATFFSVVAREAGISLRGADHVPVLVFLFAIAFFNRRIGPLLAIIAMAVVTGKNANFPAMLCIVIAHGLFNRRMTFGFLLLLVLLVFAFSPVIPLIFGLQTFGGNLAPLGEFIALLKTGSIDDRTLAIITSNRSNEYLSVFQDWADHGIPFFGRGLGATVLVDLGWSSEVVERSTLHNSFLVVFQTTGIFGLFFVAYYVFTPTWRLRKVEPEIVLTVVGYVVYAFFSNTLLQAPSLVFCLALAKRLSEQRSHSKPLRRDNSA